MMNGMGCGLTKESTADMIKKKGGAGMKMVDTKEYLDMVSGLLQEGRKNVPLTVAGSSMTPFFHHGDTVYLNPPAEPLKKGDVVLYVRPTGQYVLHRIVKVNADGSFIMLGDVQTQREWIEGSAAVRGIVVKVQHRGKVLTEHSFRWRFFEKIWPNVVPLRPAIMSAWKVIARK